MGEGMTEAQLQLLTQQTVGLAYLFVGVAGLFLFLAHIGPDGLRRWERLRDHFFIVKGSVGPASDYVTSDEPEDDERYAFFRDGINETAKNETDETPDETPLAPASLDINALRFDVRAAALGALLASGLIKDGKRTEAVRAVFGDVSGEAYSRAARAVRNYEAKVVPLPPETPPAPVELKPMSGAPRPPGVVYAGEVAETP